MRCQKDVLIVWLKYMNKINMVTDTVLSVRLSIKVIQQM